MPLQESACGGIKAPDARRNDEVGNGVQSACTTLERHTSYPPPFWLPVWFTIPLWRNTAISRSNVREVIFS